MAVELQNATKVLKIDNKTYTLDPDYLGGKVATDYATVEDVNTRFANIASALKYKGKLTPSGTPASCYTPAATVGDVYVISAAGSVNGVRCETQDLWICNKDCVAATSSNASTINTNWDVVQGNIDLTNLDNTYADLQHTHSVTIAQHNTSEESITPSGTVSKPSFTGTAAKHKHTASQGQHSHTFNGSAEKHAHTFTGSNTTFTGSFKPEGTISKIEHTPSGTIAVTSSTPTTTGTGNYTPVGTNASNGKHSHTGNVSISYTPAGTVTISKASSGTANYTPAGTNQAVEKHSHSFSASVNYTPAGTNSEVEDHTHTVSASGKYTPAGTVESHTHTPTVTVGTTKYATAVTASGGGVKTSYADGVLSITSDLATATVSASSVPSVTVGIGNTAPGFTGTEGNISVGGTAAAAGKHSHTFSGTSATITHSGTTEGSGDHTHTFTGTGARLTASFSGTAATLEDDFTTSEVAAHTHTFTGKESLIEAAFTGNAFSVTPTFTGTSKSVSVSGTPLGTIQETEITPAGTLDTVSAGIITIQETEITPAGSVSQPTFTGTASTHKHTCGAHTATTSDATEH